MIYWFERFEHWRLVKLSITCCKQDRWSAQKRCTNLLQVDSSEKHDLKLKVDSTDEKLIRNKLAKYSSLPVLLEEFGTKQTNLLSKSFWVIVSMDGTVNYFKGNPSCCVSIGIWNEMNPFNRNSFLNFPIFLFEWH